MLMNKFISILLLLIFIVGCSHLPPQREPTSDGNSDIIYDNVDSEDGTYVGEDGYVYTKDAQRIIIDTMGEDISRDQLVTLTEGDTLNYNGQEIKVEKLSRHENLVLKIGDQVRVIDVTKLDLIVNDIIVYVEQFDFENNQATVKFKPLELGENEYLLKIDGTANIGGSVLTLDQISSDDLHYVTVNVYTSYGDQKSGRVRQGGTIVVGDVKVTNVQSNPRSITLEKYAILRLEAR